MTQAFTKISKVQENQACVGISGLWVSGAKTVKAVKNARGCLKVDAVNFSLYVNGFSFWHEGSIAALWNPEPHTNLPQWQALHKLSG